MYLTRDETDDGKSLVVVRGVIVANVTAHVVSGIRQKNKKQKKREETRVFVGTFRIGLVLLSLHVHGSSVRDGLAGESLLAPIGLIVDYDRLDDGSHIHALHRLVALRGHRRGIRNARCGALSINTKLRG